MWVEKAVKGGGQSEGFGVKGVRQLNAREDRVVVPERTLASICDPLSFTGVLKVTERNEKEGRTERSQILISLQQRRTEI